MVKLYAKVDFFDELNKPFIGIVVKINKTTCDIKVKRSKKHNSQIYMRVSKFNNKLKNNPVPNYVG